MVEHRLELFRELSLGTLMNQAVFLDVPRAGPSASYVICNSVPKAGTYLLVELVKALGGHVDAGYHTYSSSISRVHADGSFDYERAIPAPLWASALKPGYLCASHTEYCPHLEQYFLRRKEHKMLFIVRDPRDLVISWVDFVYNSTSYPKMRRWNAYLRETGTAANPDDASQISSTILALPQTGIRNFMSWIDSPACLTIRFEELYSELTERDRSTATFPVLDRICDYLDVPRKSPSALSDIIGRGLTSSGRPNKIGAYQRRMTPHHLDLLCSDTFQNLVVEFGYEPTRRATQSQQDRLVTKINRRLAALIHS
jgi:hypothetical protein